MIKDHTRSIRARLHIIKDSSVAAVALAGAPQKVNAALALQAAHLLGAFPEESALNHALMTSFLPGRIEKVGPHIIMDVAHNPSSMLVLVEHLKNNGFDGRMLRRAQEYLPGLADLLVIRCWTGFRAATPDKLPLIGPAAGSAHMYLATGHEGLGITTSLATGKLVGTRSSAVRPPFPISLTCQAGNTRRRMADTVTITVNGGTGHRAGGRNRSYGGGAGRHPHLSAFGNR